VWTEDNRSRKLWGPLFELCQAPSIPGLFFDSGLDFKWEDSPMHPIASLQSELDCELQDKDRLLNIKIEADNENSISVENCGSKSKAPYDN
jgi:hypothetical protein